MKIKKNAVSELLLKNNDRMEFGEIYLFLRKRLTF